MASIGGDGKQLTLNLYPMLDVLSILVCFLLMNFSTEAQSIETQAQLELPKSGVMLSLDTAASVSITKSALVIQAGQVLEIPLQAGDIPESEREQGVAVKRAYPVFQVLRKNQETLRNRDKSIGLSEKDLNVLTLEADKSTSFRLIRRVLVTAQQAEFVSWNLAVDKLSVN